MNITSHDIVGFVKALDPNPPSGETSPVVELIDWPVITWPESKGNNYSKPRLIWNILNDRLSRNCNSDEYRNYRKHLKNMDNGSSGLGGKDNCKRGIAVHWKVEQVEKGVSKTNVFSRYELTFLTLLGMCRHDKEVPGTSRHDRGDLSIIEKFLTEKGVPKEEILNMVFSIEGNKIKCGSKEDLHDFISCTTQLFLRFPGISSIMKKQTIHYPKIHDALYRKTSKQYEDPYCIQEGRSVSFGLNYLGLETFLESTEERVLHLTTFQTTGLNPARLCYNVLNAANDRNTTLYKLGEHCTFLSWTDLQQINESVDVAAKFANVSSAIDRLLVVDCSEENELNESGVKLFEKLLSELKRNQPKKLIVITNDEIQSRIIRGWLEDYDIRRKEVAMRSPEWRDLTEDFQKELLARKVVTFQGRDTLTSLSALVTGPDDESHPSWDSIIDAETIVKLIQGEEIRIGEKPLSMSDLEAAYSRPNETISMEHLLNALTSSNHLFMMSGVENMGSDQEELIVKLKQNGKLFETGLDEVIRLREFRKLCRDNPSRIIHMVKVEAQNQCAQWLMLYDGTFYFKRKINYRAKIVLRKKKIMKLILKEDTDSFIFQNVFNEDELMKVFGITGKDKVKFLSKVSNRKIVFRSSNANVDASEKTHWLNVERPNNVPQIVWTRSKGSLDILRDTIDHAKSTVSSINEVDFTKIKEKLVINADEPGMGKSTTLTSLSDQLTKSSWVVRVDLGNCQEAISKLPPSCSFNDAVTFVNDIYNTSSSSPLTRSLLEWALKNTTQMFLMFDAFDEIKEADHENTSNKKVINLLKCLQEETTATIWITTRQHKRETLENSLSVFSFSFESIKEKEQQVFLKNFWQVRRSLKTNPDSRVEENDFFNKFATTLLTEAKNMLGLRISSLICVPMQMRMLAEAFLPEVESSISSNDLSNIKLQNVNILYRKFITAKYNIYFKEKIKLSSDSAKDLQYITKTVNEKFTKIHRTLAFYHLCPGELINFTIGKSLDSEEFKDDTTELFRIGLIELHPGQQQFQFIHLSFSEYFTADSLNHWLNKSKGGRVHHDSQTHLVDFLLTQIFLESKFRNVRTFLNYMLETNKLSLSRYPHTYPRDGQDRTAIHTLAEEDQLNIAKCLLSDNVGVISKEVIDGQDKERLTALHLAAREGHGDFVRLLIANGANVNAKGKLDDPPLHLAANGHVDVVRVLLENGAGVNTQNEDGRTPLHVATSGGHKDVVLVLLQNGATLNVCDNTGYTPLHRAAKRRHGDVVKVLLEKKAEVNTQNEKGDTPLHDAASRGQTATVQALLQHDATVDARSKTGYTPLIRAAGEGHGEVVEVLLEKKAEVNTQNENGDTPLHDAASAGHTAIVQSLLQHGATVDARSKAGYTPLQVAADMGHGDVVKVLFEKGAGVNTQDEDGWTPLHVAALQGHTSLVLMLLHHGATLEVRSKTGRTPLHVAAERGHGDVVNVLLEKGAVVNTQDEDGQTPLYVAACWGQTAIVLMLLQHGATVDARSKAGRTPLHVAAERGHGDVVKVLFEKGAGVNTQDEDGWTPLHVAAFQGHTALVLMLLHHGATLEVRSKTGRTPLHVAAERDHGDVVKVLLEKGAEVNTQSENGRTPLYVAACWGHTALVLILLQHGATVNARSMAGYTPLHVAARKGHEDVMKVLLEKRAEVNTQDEDGRTPLHDAASNVLTSMVLMLLQHGATVEARSKSGCTPLHVAARWGHEDVVKVLLEKGAGVNTQDEDGWTPLHDAASNVLTTMVLMLLQHGATVDARCKAGFTPLHVAAEKGHGDVVKMLLKKGAEFNTQSEDGWTPLQLATSRGHSHIVQMVQQHGAKS